MASDLLMFMYSTSFKFVLELAADDDGRAPDLDPATVVAGLVEQAAGPLGLDRFMVRHVEELDDLAVDQDDLRDPHGRLEAAGDPLGDAGLAVAGMAVEEQALARVDRRSDQAQGLIVDQQVGERPPASRLPGDVPRVIVWAATD